jgi:putative redox protein
METARIVLNGGLQTEMEHLRSGTKLITDAPVDNHGKGEFFSPTDLVASALGSCILTVMVLAAQQHGFDLGSPVISVVKVMQAEPRRIGEIALHFDFGKQAFTGKHEKILRYAAEHCPVAKSLHPDIKQNITFSFDKND